MSRLIDADELKRNVEQRMDMQDVYLPSHFFEIIDDQFEVVCHTNLKANAKLICEIMDADAKHRTFRFSDGSCENCKFTDNDEYQEPCVKCMHNYVNKFQNKTEKPHWIVLDDCANEGIYCSECHAKIFDFVHEPKKKLSNFCPNCGVKMRGDNNEAK